MRHRQDKAIRRLFEKLDDDSSGTVTFDEFKNVVCTGDNGAGNEETRARLLFDTLDTDGDEVVVLAELLDVLEHDHEARALAQEFHELTRLLR